MSREYTVAMSRMKSGKVRYTIGDQKPDSDTWIGIAYFQVTEYDIRLSAMELRSGRGEVRIDYRYYISPNTVQTELMKDILQQHLRGNE